MTWTDLLPEAGDEPAGFVDPGTAPRARAGRPGPSLPADPASISLDEALVLAGTAVYLRRPGADRTVRAWPAHLRRLMALRLHIDAVRNDGSPNEGPARLMPVLIDDSLRWTRSELAWALRTADDWSLFDGAAFLLPGYIAASLSAAELDGFGPALRAVFDVFVDEPDTPWAVRRQLAGLYGVAIGRVAGRLPLHLLQWSDPFGRFARRRLDERLDEPGVAELLSHAAALSRPTPSLAWLRQAGALPVTWPVRSVLELFVEYDGYVRPAGDEVLRGLAWMLSLDASEEATVLLGRVATVAGSAGPSAPNHPLAPRTAGAVLEILPARPGDVPARTLHDLDAVVGNQALLTRVRGALGRLPAPPA